MKQSILVTGGAGYIGSHICKALYLNGYIPIVLDRLEYSCRKFAKWGPFFVGHVGDRQLLRKIFNDYHPEAVIHCAGCISVSESFCEPDKYYQNNVVESFELLDEMIFSGIDLLIFSSSCAVYGNTGVDPIPEDHPKNPTTPYGRSKWMIEQIIQDLSRVFPLRYGILRYFNASGADKEGELGECHVPETHLVPLIFRAAFENHYAVSILGTDYTTKDGTAIRDYLHISDLVNGHLKAFQVLKGSTESFVVNLGSGRGYSVLEVIQIAEKLLQKKIPVIQSTRREGDSPMLIAKIDQARNILNWTPERTIEDIIISACNWYKLSNGIFG